MRVIYFNFFNFLIIKNFTVSCYLEKIGSFIDAIFIFKNSKFFITNFLVDIFVSDYLYFQKRFRLCYNFYSVIHKKDMFINLSLNLLQSGVTLYNLFKGSIWLEREVYDMFGIKFINNWDLRRILTDYTFFGYPLRKDFPLSGYMELLYDEKKKTTFEVLVEFMQEMRFFYVSSFIENWDVKDIF